MNRDFRLCVFCKQSQEILSIVLYMFNIYILKRQLGMTPGFCSEKMEFHLELQLTERDQPMKGTELEDRLRILLWMFNLKCPLKFRMEMSTGPSGLGLELRYVCAEDTYLRAVTSLRNILQCWR